MSHHSSTISTIDSFLRRYLEESRSHCLSSHRLIDEINDHWTHQESHDAERLLQQLYQIDRGEVALFEEMKRESNRVGLNQEEVLRRWEEKINAAGLREVGGALLGEPAKRFREIKLENDYYHSQFEIVREMNNHVRYLNAHWASATLEQRKHRLNEIKKLQSTVWDLRDELDYECRREGFNWDLMNSRLRLREVPMDLLHGEAKKEFEKLESNAGTDRVVQPRAEFVARSRRE